MFFYLSKVEVGIKGNSETATILTGSDRARKAVLQGFSSISYYSAIGDVERFFGCAQRAVLTAVN
jgi:hypothetical protein